MTSYRHIVVIMFGFLRSSSGSKECKRTIGDTTKESELKMSYIKVSEKINKGKLMRGNVLYRKDTEIFKDSNRRRQLKCFVYKQL